MEWWSEIICLQTKADSTCYHKTQFESIQKQDSNKLTQGTTCQIPEAEMELHSRPPN